MKHLLGSKLLIIAFLAGNFACSPKVEVQPPIAQKIPYELVTGSHTRTDNYYWMNNRENPEVIAYLNSENAYLQDFMKSTEPLQEKLYNEIKSKIKEADQSVPFPENGYYYYSRTVPVKEYLIWCRKKATLDAAEEILLDINAMAEGHAYFSLGGLAASTDNKLMAYSVDTLSRRNYTIYFKNLETGEKLVDEIPMATGSMVWGNDNRSVYYVVRNPQTLRSEKIRKHTLGTDAGQDTDVYFEPDETFSVRIFKTRSEKYLVISSESTLTSEFRYLEANSPNASWKVIQPRKRGLEYSIDHAGDFFYILTNLEATNFRLMKTPVTKTSIENWVEVIPHRNDVLLSEVAAFKNYLALTEKKEGINQLRIMDWKGANDHYVSFDEEVFACWLGVNQVFDTEILRFQYSSLTTPASTFDYNMTAKTRVLMKQDEIPGGFNPADYETKREFATASDGTKIPLSIVYKKGIAKNGSHPALLYGYGSYGITMEPSFRLSILPLLDRGFVYAIAHIRGEQFYGRKWYDDGKLLNKMNTFTDFNSCAEYLVNEKYTSAKKLFAKGGSAGGLLMGTCVNLRPDLFRGVIANVPFVDVVTTMLDESIPLTTSEFDEWGNPKDETYYNYMLSYSPYDNVEAKPYPSMLVTTGLHDSQVQYWEPAKWVAKLRDMKTDKNPLLFHINMEYGHGGASGRYQWIKDLALEYAFILKEIDIK